MKNMKLFKIPFLILTMVFFLSACAGTDIPWAPFKDEVSPGGGGVNGGGGTPPPTEQPVKGCLIEFTGMNPTQGPSLRMDTKMEDGSGYIKGDKRALPYPIKLHFDGNKVTMLGREFREFNVIVTEAKRKLFLKQKDGTTAEGTSENETDQIKIPKLDQVVFVMQVELGVGNRQPATPHPLAPFYLTTDKNFQIKSNNNTVLLKGFDDGSDKDSAGNGGAAYAFEASPLNKNTKKITLVGGGKIVQNFPLDQDKGTPKSLDNMAVLIVLEGQFNQVPGVGDCTGGGGGNNPPANLIFQELDVNNNPVDLPANNTLNFGTIFVPEKGQAGEDPAPATDERYTKQKKVRITNNGTQDITVTLNSNDDFKITPSGSITIPKEGGKVDLTIVFGKTDGMTYTADTPAITRNASLALNVQGSTLTFAGTAKRAAAELLITKQDGTSVTSIDLGNLSMLVDEPVGADPKLICNNVPTVTQKVILKNGGVRPLTNLNLNVTDDVSAPKQCGGSSTEFYGSFEAMNGTASCTPDGGGWISPCTIPADPMASIEYNLSYYPHDASPVKAKAKDSGALDATYDASGSSKLTLKAGLDPDRSGIFKVRKEGSNTEVASGGNIRINITSPATSTPINLQLLNYLGNTLDIVSIDLEKNATNQFELGTKPTSIAARTGDKNPGIATLPITFKKLAASDLTASLKIVYKETGATNTSTFQLNLVGSIDHVPLTGYVKFDIDSFTAFIDNSFVGIVDSLNFRKAKKPGDPLYDFRTGPILLKFEPVAGMGKEHLRKVTFGLPKPLEAIKDKMGNDALVMDTVRKMSDNERSQLVRLYSTLMTCFKSGICTPLGEYLPGSKVPDCDQPDADGGGINRPYKSGVCASFYYVIEPDPTNPGIYDDETGKLILPKLKLRFLNPFHQDKPTFSGTNITNTLTPATMTTETINATSIPNAYPEIWSGTNIPLVDDSIGGGELGVNSVDPGVDMSKLLADNACPVPDWTPLYDNGDVLNTFTKFGCYITPAPSYMRGYPVVPIDGEKDKYSVVVVLLMKLKDETEAPQYVPWFMAGRRMFADIHGKLIKCSKLESEDPTTEKWWPTIKTNPCHTDNIP